MDVTGWRTVNTRHHSRFSSHCWLPELKSLNGSHQSLVLLLTHSQPSTSVLCSNDRDSPTCPLLLQTKNLLCKVYSPVQWHVPWCPHSVLTFSVTFACVIAFFRCACLSVSLCLLHLVGGSLAGWLVEFFTSDFFKPRLMPTLSLTPDKMTPVCAGAISLAKSLTLPL